MIAILIGLFPRQGSADHGAPPEAGPGVALRLEQGGRLLAEAGGALLLE
jgi:hypothetical protein